MSRKSNVNKQTKLSYSNFFLFSPTITEFKLVI